MSIHSRILDVHNDILRQRGYIEDLMDAAERPGTLTDLLQAKILELLIQTFLSDKPVAFSLPMTGYFNDRRDKVQFEFCYTYDPNGPHLFLNELKAKLDNTSIRYPIWRNTARDLPTPEKAYKDLFRESKRTTITPLPPAPAPSVHKHSSPKR